MNVSGPLDLYSRLKKIINKEHYAYYDAVKQINCCATELCFGLFFYAKHRIC